MAPTADAPVMLPAHMDMLCQTSPRLDPEPDVNLFLHGKKPSQPQASVVWRADLFDENRNAWKATIALLPPSSGEMLQAPLFRIRRWLAARAPKRTEADGDVESIAMPTIARSRQTHSLPRSSSGADVRNHRSFRRTRPTSDRAMSLSFRQAFRQRVSASTFRRMAEQRAALAQTAPTSPNAHGIRVGGRLCSASRPWCSGRGRRGSRSRNCWPSLKTRRRPAARFTRH